MLGLGDEERFIMDIVPALAVILFKRRVLSRSSVDSVLSLYSLILNSSFDLTTVGGREQSFLSFFIFVRLFTEVLLMERPPIIKA